MTCKKCGSEMFYSNVYKIRAHTCFMCGNVFYTDYPKRSAPNNLCDLCGEEYEQKNMLQKHCTTCRKLNGRNFKKAMLRFAKHPEPSIMFPKAVAYSDIKLVASGDSQRGEAQLR